MTVTVTLVLWESDPVEPVTVTMYVPTFAPDGTLTVSAEVAVPPLDRPTCEGLTEGLMPAGETIGVRDTVPVSPP